MPTRALKTCTYPGCNALVRSGRCARHARSKQPDVRARKKLYDSPAWQMRRAAQLAAEPWCAECLRANIYTIATDVDHIERHEGDPTKFFSGPLQSLCHAHHSMKTAEETGWGRKD